MLTDLLAALAAGRPPPAEFAALPLGAQIKAIEAGLAALGGEQRAGIESILAAQLRRPFIPLPGPQTAALESLADELLYGGAAGGGKSALLVGCAALNHKRALILRRQSNELDGLIAEVQEMLGRDGWRSEGSGGTSTQGGRVIRFGGCREADDWRAYAGRARDYIGLDEAGEFLELQVASLIGWLRSTDPDQRCRVILGSNPPRGAEGQWIVEWFAPWLDASHPAYPAKDGELLWYIRVKEKTEWVPGPGRYERNGEGYTARSRTFIRALLAHNPYLDGAYRGTLESLPEPLRSQLLKGDFLAGREDAAWQVIPSAWIKAAQARWTEEPPAGVRMTAIGVDVAQGGPDRTVLAPRRGRWFAPLATREGVDTKDGPAVAGLVFSEMRDGCAVVIDMGGGWGGQAYGHLCRNLDEDKVVSFLGVNPSQARTQDGKLGFVNRRAEINWRFREALDPQSGENIALPPDPGLAAELGMACWKMTRQGIQIESKEDIIKRLGRSPDKADAVFMAWSEGDADGGSGIPEQYQTHANVGYERAKRRYRR